jgi:hypothetical protein
MGNRATGAGIKGFPVRKISPSALSLLPALAVVAAAVVSLWFVERRLSFDELGLSNAIYTFLRTGSMTYPVYPTDGARDAMFVHPPTHYFLVAELMHLTGLSMEASGLVIVLFWLTLGAILLVTGRFGTPWKLGGLAGLYAGLVLWAPQLDVRPDIDVAGAWLVGLLALEAGRLRNWDPRLLAVGACALTLGSALQYPSLACCLGVLVYAAWSLRDLGWRRVGWRLFGLALGGAAVGLPYLAVFVVPHFHTIVSFARQTNGAFDPVAAFEQHVAVYRELASSVDYKLSDGGPLTHFLALPLLTVGLPTVFLTTPFLLGWSDTRGIGLAALPHLLFLLLVDHPPAGEGQLYDVPEMTLLFMCAGSAVILIALAAARALKVRGGAPRAISAATGLLLLGAVIGTGRPSVDAIGTRTWHPLHDEMGLARAAGVSIVGPHALLASDDVSLWYTTGASSFYPEFPNPLLSSSPLLDMTRYAQAFTAWPVAQIGTFASYWYEQGLLHVQGFYYGAKWGSWLGTDYLIVSAFNDRPLVGYVALDDGVERFDPSSTGEYVFAVAACPSESMAGWHGGDNPPPWGLITYVPPKAGEQAWGAVPGGTVLVSMLSPQPAFDQIRQALPSGCAIRDSARVQGTKVTVAQLMENAKRQGSDQTMDFPSDPAPVATLYSPYGPTKNIGDVPIEASEVSSGNTLEKTQNGWRVVTSPALWAQTLQAPLDPTPSGESRWVRVEGSVEAGAIGICIRDLSNGDCMIRRRIDASTPGPYDLPIPGSAHAVALFIDNEQPGGSKLALQSVGILKQDPGG